jgi:hypothetical protein
MNEMAQTVSNDGVKYQLFRIFRSLLLLENTSDRGYDKTLHFMGSEDGCRRYSRNVYINYKSTRHIPEDFTPHQHGRVNTSNPPTRNKLTFKINFQIGRTNCARRRQSALRVLQCEIKQCIFSILYC